MTTDRRTPAQRPCATRSPLPRPRRGALARSGDAAARAGARPIAEASSAAPWRRSRSASSCRTAGCWAGGKDAPVMRLVRPARFFARLGPTPRSASARPT